MKRHGGFSLVEIMIGMVLGLFITIGIMQLFIGSNRNYQFYDAFARIQENGRFALELLNNTIRMANFTGCALTSNGTDPLVGNVLRNNRTNTNPDWWVDVNGNKDELPPFPSRPAWEGMLRGYDGNQEFPDPFGSSPAARIEGTDAIISLGGSGKYPIVAANAQVFTLGQIARANGRPLRRGDLMLVCDNNANLTLFQITSQLDINNPPYVVAHGTDNTIVPGNQTADTVVYSPNAPNPPTTDTTTTVVYTDDDSMVDYAPTAFYIGASSSGATCPPSRSLFQMQLTVTEAGVARMEAQEVVEGVWDMQIYYGEDTSAPVDGIPDVYVNAPNVANWARVVSVRIHLLLVSLENNILSQEQTYLYTHAENSRISGVTVTATTTLCDDQEVPDKRWYQVFTTTIGIRNRLK